MQKIRAASYQFTSFEALSQRASVLHRLHPVAKLLTTCLYIAFVTSFGKYDFVGLFPMALYPFAVLTAAGFPARPFFKTALLAQPVIFLVGIYFPFVETEQAAVLSLSIPLGWIALACLMLKGLLVVTAALLFIATTGMSGVGAALRRLHIPRPFVLQLMLTYRYSSVLLQEVSRITLAYSLRAPAHKGVRLRTWGPLAGQLLLRTLDRAGRTYEAMRLRGFDGEYRTGREAGFSARDMLYLAACTGLFLAFRLGNIAFLLGNLVL